MKDFNFVSPTRIHFGKNAMNFLSEEIKNKYKKALLVYGQNSIKKIGVYDEVISQLSSANIEYFEISGVRPNPEISKVKDSCCWWWFSH